MILVHVTTIAETLFFFKGQITYLKERGLQIHAVSSPGAALGEVAQREKIPVHPITMHRRISPLRDIASLFKLYRLFRELKPAVVHAHTPKGGLLGVIAARLARVPVVIYGMHGLPFVTARGLKRRLLRWSEAVSCRLADQVLAVSHANRRLAVAEGFCGEEKIAVLGNGSVNGVDARGRFNPQKLPSRTHLETRSRYQIPRDGLVLGFVGRIVRDKGIVELEEAWQLLKNSFPQLHLLMVGPIEPQDPVPPPVLQRLEEDPRVHFTGSMDDVVPFYAAMDILVLPTHREGFPVTPLEAAAMELPVVTTTVDGCVEAVTAGVTGLIVPVKDVPALAGAIQELLLDQTLRRRLGQEGRKRVLRDFNPENLWQSSLNIYLSLLGLHPFQEHN